MACARPPSSCLPGWRAGCSRLHLQGSRVGERNGLAVLLLSLLARQALRAPPTCAFLWPGNLGMDRLGAISLERETSWRRDSAPQSKGHYPAVLHEMRCQLPR